MFPESFCSTNFNRALRTQNGKMVNLRGDHQWSDCTTELILIRTLLLGGERPPGDFERIPETSYLTGHRIRTVEALLTKNRFGKQILITGSVCMCVNCDSNFVSFFQFEVCL